MVSQYRKDNNELFFPPLGLGIEIETGGHVFHLFFMNNAAILEKYQILFHPGVKGSLNSDLQFPGILISEKRIVGSKTKDLIMLPYDKVSARYI